MTSIRTKSLVSGAPSQLFDLQLDRALGPPMTCWCISASSSGTRLLHRAALEQNAALADDAGPAERKAHLVYAARVTAAQTTSFHWIQGSW